MAETDPAKSTNSPCGKRLLVVDGHSLAFRAYFALPAESFSTSDGQATNAVYGFTTMLAQVLKNRRPSHVAVAFDVKGGTFRNRLLPEYKGTRDAAPEDLLSQLPLIQDLLRALDISYVEKQGLEGDDIIATLATMGEEEGYETFVLSGDRDAFQLVDDSITVLYPGHHFKDLKPMTPEAVREKYKVAPAQYPDLAAMRGEQADNIPGIPGVGDGYAAKWINEFGGLQGIIEHASEIGGKKGEALRSSIDQILLNRKVNALVRDADLGVDLDDFKLHEPHITDVDAVFTSLQFGRNIQNRILGAMAIAEGRDEKSAAASVQSSRQAHQEGFPEGRLQPDSGPLSAQAGSRRGAGNGFEDSADDINPSRITVIEPDPLYIPASAASSEATESPSASLPDGSGGLQPAVRWLEENIQNAFSGTSVSNPSDTSLPGAQPSGEPGRVWVMNIRGTVEKGASSAQSVSFMTSEGSACVIAAENIRRDRQLKDMLRTVCRDCSGSLVIHDFKKHIHLLGSLGATVENGEDIPVPLSDTKLEGYLVQPDATARIQSASQYAGYFLHIDTDEAAEPAAEQGAFDFDGGADVAPADTADSAEAVKRQAVRDARECAYVLAMHELFSPVIAARSQISLLKDIELPVSRVLAHMEIAGSGVDQQRLLDMRDSFTSQAQQAQQVAWDQVGKEINLQSPKQLQSVLFDDMGLAATKKTKSGNYTTNAAALQELYIRSVHNERANTFLGALLRHREVNKLKQIVQTLMDSVNTHDGRIHTTFEQTVAATGRLSSTDPNLQNIPNRNVEGREIRAAFVPSQEYVSLLSCDYSQVELRLMAHLSQDEALIEAFRSGADFHKYVASLVYDIPIDRITADQRSHIKAMSYGLAYGLSTYGLAQQLGISPAQSDVLKDKYFATFGRVHDYLESLVSQAKSRGYTETMFGRRRYFPQLRSPRRQLRDAAERAALNAPIQGSAADIMKIAMEKAYTQLCEARVKSRIILQIHDELVVELVAGEEEEVTGIVREAMEHAVDLAVPLDVSTGTGTDWQLAAH